MGKKYISRDSSSVRMFKSDFLEALSKVHYLVPVYLYLPVIGFCFYLALDHSTSFKTWIIFGFLGIVIWSLVEYLMHRFIFHYKAKTVWGKRLHFIMHGVHHDYPNDAHRLVMPPSVSIPLAVLFYFFFRLFINRPELEVFYGFFLAGYLIYDLGHYAIHHCRIKHPIIKAIKKNHMQHHFMNENRGFGVSSSLWDKLLDTSFYKGPDPTDPFYEDLKR